MSIKTWSSEQELELVSLYAEQDIKDVHELAEHFQKGYRSVISKLVQLKVYEKPQLEEEVKAQTVKTMLRELENMLDIEIDGTNLNKKENLTKLVEALREKLNGYNT
jgi:predicted transcriptional regulator